MTRAEVTTMFARLLTEQIEADKTYSSTFNDVAKDCWAANYIGYMQQFGIVTGYEDGSFRPDAPVTRAEFAAIASRFEKLTQGSAELHRRAGHPLGSQIHQLCSYPWLGHRL